MQGGFLQVSNWFSAENQGGGIAVADLNGDGTQDLVVFMIDNPPDRNRGVYQVGHSLDANGNVTGGWTEVLDLAWVGQPRRSAPGTARPSPAGVDVGQQRVPSRTTTGVSSSQVVANSGTDSSR